MNLRSIFLFLGLLLLLSGPTVAQRTPSPPPGKGLPAVGMSCYPSPDCIGCQPGECAAIAHRLTPNGDYVHTPDPPCAGHNNQRITQLLRQLAASYEPSVAEYAGPVFEYAGNEIASAVKQYVRGGDLGRILSVYTEPAASCELVCVYLPKSSTWTGYAVAYSDYYDGYRPKLPGDSGQWNKWLEPSITESSTTKALCGVFMNWSDDRNRGAWLIGYFKR